MLNGPAYKTVKRCFAAGLAASFLAFSGGWAIASSDSSSGGQATGIEAVEATVVSFDSARSSSILASQINSGNTIIETNGVHRTALENSVIGGAGIFVINQDTGNFANQANIVVITLGATPGSVIDDISALLYSRVTENSALITGGARSNRIAGSFGNTAGVVAINQSSGNFNNQINAFSLSLGVSGKASLVALSDTTLAAVAGANNAAELKDAGPRSDTITDSFDGFRGIGLVNQVSGDGNVVSSSVALSVQVTTLR